MIPDGHKYSALVATNDQALPRLLGAILAPAGFSMKFVRTEVARTEFRKAEYTLVIVDGDLLAPVRPSDAAIIVVGSSNPVRAYDLGADLVVDKPIVANVFMAKIRAVMRRFGIVL